MEPTPSPQNQEQDEEIIKILNSLGSIKAEYPPELFAARRAAFVVQVEQYSRTTNEEKLLSRKKFVKRLKDLQSVKTEYPPELLATRRAAFIAQVEQLNKAEIRGELTSGDHKVISLLMNLRSIEAEYPPTLLVARRSAFLRQIPRGESISLLEKLRVSIQRIFRYRFEIPRMPGTDLLRASLVVAGLIVAAF